MRLVRLFFVLAFLLRRRRSERRHHAPKPRSSRPARSPESVIVPGQPEVVAGGVGRARHGDAGAADGFAYPADGIGRRDRSALRRAYPHEGAGCSGRHGRPRRLALQRRDHRRQRRRPARRPPRPAPTPPARRDEPRPPRPAGDRRPANQRFPLADWGYAVTLEQTSRGARRGRHPQRARGRDRAARRAHRRPRRAAGGRRDPRRPRRGGRIDARRHRPVTTVPRTTRRSRSRRSRAARRRAAEEDEAAAEAARARDGRAGLRSTSRRPPTFRRRSHPGATSSPSTERPRSRDTFGAPRAGVGWHHGEDIFAPLGAPLLAVADGTVFSVGWNDRRRLPALAARPAGKPVLLRAPLGLLAARANGNEVRAGAVIGFVGNTGRRAEHAVPPALRDPPGRPAAAGLRRRRQRLPVPERLAAARGRRRSPPDAAGRRRCRRPRPRRGRAPSCSARRDISSASGLEPGSLERALVAPVSAEGDGALLAIRLAECLDAAESPSRTAACTSSRRSPRR